MEPRPKSFYILAAVFGLFLLFLYGPTITIAILSFQGPEGGLTFPMRGASLHWFDELFQQQAVGDIWGSFRRSLALGAMVMVTTVVVSVMGGLAFRKRFAGSGLLFYLVIAALVIPSILVSAGRRADLPAGACAGALGDLRLRRATDLDAALRPADHVRGLQPVRRRLRGGRPRSGRQRLADHRHVVLPIIAPSLIGVALFGFTLSYDEFARTLLTAGSYNTLPLEIFGMTTNVTTPVIFALGTLTTVFSFADHRGVPAERAGDEPPARAGRVGRRQGRLIAPAVSSTRTPPRR